jgi:selenocysteine-specific elongation factor
VARVAVNLRGVPRDAVARGDALLAPDAWLAVSTLDARLTAVRGDGIDAQALPGELTLHVGSVATPVRVRPLGPDTVRLRLARALPLRIGDRAVLRDPGRRQVAAGLLVLDVGPPELRRRGAAAARADALTTLTGAPDAADELVRRGVVRRAELRAMGVPAADLDALGPATSGWLLSKDAAIDRAGTLAAALTAHDAADPVDPGLPVEAARRAAGLPDARLIEPMLRLSGRADLVVRDGRVGTAVQKGTPADLRAALDALRDDLRTEPFAAPDAQRLAELGLGQRQLASLVRAGELLRVADGVVLLPGADTRAVEVLSGLGPEFTLSEARQALHTSRRVAVPLLELLARSGRTTRTPDGGHRLT